MHTTSGRWKLGAALALTTALMWGVLPIALKYTLVSMDAVTITWYRFAVATVVLALLLARRRKLPRFRSLDGTGRLLLLIAILGLCGNYLFYLLGLDFVTPGTAQVVVQLAPMLLLLGALVIFRERFALVQWLGLAVFAGGLLLFFNRDLGLIFAADSALGPGVAWVVASAVVWAGYALAQKQLLKSMNSEGILLCVYFAAVLLFLPGSDLGSIVDIDQFTFWMLVFASVNTLIAYGAFAEALAHLEASRVSAIIAIVPLLTLAAMVALNALVPDIALPEPLSPLKLGGAGLVVVGSMLTALGGRRQKAG